MRLVLVQTALLAASLLLTHCDRKASEPESRPSATAQAPSHVESSSWYRLEVPTGWRARNLSLAALPGAVTDDASNDFTVAFESRDGLNAVSIGRPQELVGTVDDYRERISAKSSTLSTLSCDKQGRDETIGGALMRLISCHRRLPEGTRHEAALALFVKDSTVVQVLCESTDARSGEQCGETLRSFRLKDDFKRVALEWVELSSNSYVVSVPPGWQVAPMLAVQRRAKLALTSGASVAVLTIGRATLTLAEALKVGLSPKDKELVRKEAKLLGLGATDVVVKKESGAMLFSRVAVDAGTLYDLECTGPEPKIEETCAKIADLLRRE
jgi:hypothetical protein